MWSGSKKIIGGFVFLLLLLSSGSGWGQDSTSGKQKAIELLLQQRILLTQSQKDIEDSRQAIKTLEKELVDIKASDEQLISDLKRQLDERKKVYQEQAKEIEKLLKSIALLELSLKASQSATECAVAIAVILGTVAIIEGLIIIFKK